MLQADNYVLYIYIYSAFKICYSLGEVCSHAAAVLFKMELATRVGLTTVSSTSDACKWNQTFREQVLYNMISARAFYFNI